ncbi:MAG: HNH endonuclease [Acidimicrobiia bacterium]|nr:HNH endonuclease [Acidimicrobiia bacterium]
MFDPAEELAVVTADPVIGDAAACRRVLAAAKRLRAYVDQRCAAHLAGLDDRVVRADGAVNKADLVRQSTSCSVREADNAAQLAAQLPAMPATRDALGAGDITADHAAALALTRSARSGQARCVFDSQEPELVDHARRQSPEQFRRTLRDWHHRRSEDDGISKLQAQKDMLRLSIGLDDAGMTTVHGELDPESGAMVGTTLREIAEELWRAQNPAARASVTVPFVTNNNRLMADALVETCRRAKAAGAADARPSVPTMIVTIPHGTLVDQLVEAGEPARLADDTPIPAATARRLACDAQLIPVVLGGDSQPLDVGRGRRLATHAQRVALRTTQSTCAANGCDMPFDYCDIHHHTPWQVGGGSDLSNLTPLCSKHHHLIHEGGWRTRRHSNGSLEYLRPPTRAPDRPGPRERRERPEPREPREPREHPCGTGRPAPTLVF